MKKLEEALNRRSIQSKLLRNILLSLQPLNNVLKLPPRKTESEQPNYASSKYLYLQPQQLG